MTIDGWKCSTCDDENNLLLGLLVAGKILLQFSYFFFSVTFLNILSQ